MQFNVALRNLLFGSVVMLLAGCSSSKAADSGLKDAQARVLSADQVTVVTPTKDSWFNKNITDLPAGKEIAIKVKPDSDQEFILVKSKDGDAVILPITDGKCSVVTDKDTVAKYQAKVGGSKALKSSSGEGSGSGSGSSGSWKIKGKTITAGMSKEQVKKLLGNPSMEQNDCLMYYDGALSSAVSGAKSGVTGMLPFGGRFVDQSTDSMNPVTKKIWEIHFSGGAVDDARKTESR